MSEVSTTIIISNPPFNAISGKEGVDLALVCAAFDHQVNLIFVDQGVLHLVNNQDGSFFLDKLHDKQLGALEYYEIENLYAENESLARFQLTNKDLLDSVKCISSTKIRQLVNSSTHTVNF